MCKVIGPTEKPSKDAEMLASFDAVPLFMKSLPDDGSQDMALAALQSLVHEGSPDDIAQNFKEQGNEYFKAKRYRDAISFYNQGVDAMPMDSSILEALLLNRAACDLEFHNYGAVLRDCSRVLSMNSNSPKAYYRSGQALVSLDRLEEALDCCTRCLSYDPTNESMRALHAKATKRKQQVGDKESKKQEAKREEEGAKRALQLAFRERNLVVNSKPGVSSSPVVPHLDKGDPARRTLIFPVFFLYPQHATSDMISEFHEDTTFVAHLQTMFPPQAPPPEWDKIGEYTTSNLVVYATTHRKRLLKVGKRMTLREVLKASKEKEGQSKDGLELKDNFLSFSVMPKGVLETKWMEDFKETRNLE